MNAAPETDVSALTEALLSVRVKVDGMARLYAADDGTMPLWSSDDDEMHAVRAGLLASDWYADLTATRERLRVVEGERDAALPQPNERPWCRDCGPGYRIGDEGCRHDRDYEASQGDSGICRTCAQPIWWETGEVGHIKRMGWSDRIKRGGDSVVCFKAVSYRHVPMGAREEAIYRAGAKQATSSAEADRDALRAGIEALVAEWERPGPKVQGTPEDAAAVLRGLLPGDGR